MATPLPKPPGNLHPLAREVLERLAGHAEAAAIVIGGGVALSHYLEYRPTVDLDAWWHGEPRADVMAFLEVAMQALASRVIRRAKTGHRVGGIERKNPLVRTCWQGA
jgi:hypothetical protein